ncbi:glycosyltransferase family 4 protein [Arenimonas sp.]|uniref:glycosyltransferase n=1 Tax=Arenimonas sp. TaxID=1872635 RepID=UPI0025C55D33|nr:glycosyltransferase family 4 protein [Arenimonas sp.]
MKKLVFVTDRIESSAFGGREQLSRLLANALADIYGGQMETVSLSEAMNTPPVLLQDLLKGHVNGASRGNIASIVERVKNLHAGEVFLNGSNLGRVAQGVREACPSVRITTFFHNCEARFFLGAVRHQPSIRALGVLLANYRAERAAVRCSQNLICLNERDSSQLERTYGRRGTHLLPMALKDQLPDELPAQPPGCAERYALFVGGTFYANRQGIEWFVEQVAARSPLKTYVVGKGFESWKVELERNGNVEVIGGVDSLVPWYLGAHVVIAPIFDGSGMKTKVAEALMFGKRVVGTPEAFVGYEAIVGRAGAVCESPSDFLAALETEASRPFTGIDPELRACYEDRHSFQTARDQLVRILAA